MTDRICPECGGPLRPTQRADAIFCSRTHRQRRYRRRVLAAGRAALRASATDL